MFKGIIEEVGIVDKIEKKGGGSSFFIQSSLALTTKVGNSISINGVCTTVIKKEGRRFSFYASPETLALTNLMGLREGDKVNLENALTIGDTMDGHFISGHVDKKTQTTAIKKKAGSTLISFALAKSDRVYLIPKGSISINGISLTVYRIEKNSFQVMIIPFTYENTNLMGLEIGSWVNIEFDSLGKYLKNFYENTMKHSS